MRMSIQKTGPFGFGLMYHVIHVSDDLSTINAWYQKVFDADVWMGLEHPHWSEIEDRYAALLSVGDLCIEPMAPKLPPDDRYPVARFFLRNGSRFHSAGHMVDDIEGFARHLLDHDVYIGLPGGGRMEEVPPDIYYFYPSPRSVGGYFAQITRNTDGTYSSNVADDPRLHDDWDVRARRWSEHPLGIQRLGYGTMAVSDVDATRAIFEKLWLAVPVHEGVDEDAGYGRTSCSSGTSSSSSRRRCRTTGPSRNTSNGSATCSTSSRSASTTSTRWRRTSPPSTCAANERADASSAPTPTTASAPTTPSAPRPAPATPSPNLHEPASANQLCAGLLTPVC